MYMNMPSGFDTMPDTYCLSLNGCVYSLCESSRVVFMLTCEVYMQVGFTKLMHDRYVFMKLEINIIGDPAMQSIDDNIVMDFGFYEYCTTSSKDISFKSSQYYGS